MIGWVYFVITTTSKDLQHWPRRLLRTHLLVCLLAWCLSLTDWVRNVNKSLAVALTFAAITYSKVRSRFPIQVQHSNKNLDLQHWPRRLLRTHLLVCLLAWCLSLTDWVRNVNKSLAVALTFAAITYSKVRSRFWIQVEHWSKIHGLTQTITVCSDGRVVVWRQWVLQCA